MGLDKLVKTGKIPHSNVLSFLSHDTCANTTLRILITSVRPLICVNETRTKLTAYMPVRKMSRSADVAMLFLREAVCENCNRMKNVSFC